VRLSEYKCNINPETKCKSKLNVNYSSSKGISNNQHISNEKSFPIVTTKTRNALGDINKKRLTALHIKDLSQEAKYRKINKYIGKCELFTNSNKACNNNQCKTVDSKLDNCASDFNFYTEESKIIGMENMSSFKNCDMSNLLPVQKYIFIN